MSEKYVSFSVTMRLKDLALIMAENQRVKHTDYNAFISVYFVSKMLEIMIEQKTKNILIANLEEDFNQNIEKIG